MILISVFAFFTVFTSVFLVNSAVAGSKIAVRSRLGSISVSKSASSLEEAELTKSFYARVVQPIMKRMSSFLVKVTPKQITGSFENKIIAAGTPFNFGVSEWITLQVFLIMVLPLVFIALGFAFKAPTRNMVGVVGMEILLGLMAPNMVLSSKIQQRQKEIIKTLPDILDLLTVSVEAGLGFDSALGKVVEKAPGVLAREFDRVLQEIKMGKPKKDALRSMSDRVSVVDFTTFIASIIQAEQLGVSIGKVLRIQSHQIRLRRRQRAQERAMKAPVKMLIPMVVFIFPTIFTVILGPAVIKLMNNFSR